MGKTDFDYVTKGDSKQALKELYRDLRADIRHDVQKDMQEMVDRQTELFRDELDGKLSALEERFDNRLGSLESRLMAHTKEVVGNNTIDLLDNIASVIDPNRTGLKGWKFRNFRNM